RWWDIRAISSWARREIAFSFAIFSADSPIVWPVVDSAIAGATGARSAGRSLAIAASFCGSVFALESAMNIREAFFENRIGTFDSDSAPPASTASASPARIASAPNVIARFDEAHAKLTVVPTTSCGSDRRNTTSRPRFGAWSAGITQPNTERSISVGSIPVRAISSPAAALERSTTSMLAKSVPALANGVRQPSTKATRPCAPRSAARPTAVTAGRRAEPVHTVSARSEISSRTEASFGGGSGEGGEGGNGGETIGSADMGPPDRFEANVYHGYDRNAAA